MDNPIISDEIYSFQIIFLEHDLELHYSMGEFQVLQKWIKLFDEAHPTKLICMRVFLLSKIVCQLYKRVITARRPHSSRFKARPKFAF
jgi:hypothetical protein